jgi:excisionase family DNA binding protein
MPVHDPDDLLRPREVAEIFDVRTATIARWAREGRLSPVRTPGGHRRYPRAAILRLLAADEPDPEETLLAQDAARLYEQGWSIRQVAERFDCGYGTMRRLLRKHVALRKQGGAWASYGDTQVREQRHRHPGSAR